MTLRKEKYFRDENPKLPFDILTRNAAGVSVRAWRDASYLVSCVTN